MELNSETGASPARLNSESEVETACGVGGATAVAHPSAEPGNVCVFAAIEEEIKVAAFDELALPPNESPLWISPAPEYGALVPFSLEEQNFGIFAGSEGGYANGSWAVSTE